MTATPAPAATALPAAVPLDRCFDADRMAAEVRGLRAGRWRRNRPIGSAGLGDEDEADWTVMALRAPGGDPSRTDPGGPALAGYADTPLLAATPYLATVLAAVPAPLRSVRLMALAPGARVHTHRDGNLGIPWGWARLHVPVLTNPGAELVIEDRAWHWEAGRLWYGDFDRPHHVRNTGGERRVHLVIDCTVTRELLGLFPAEFRDRLPWHEVLLSRPEVPLHRFELDRFACRGTAPAAFADWSEDGTAGDADLDCAVEVRDDRLVLVLDGTPAYGLVHVGGAEFRPLAWCDERTVHIDPERGELRFVVRRGGTQRVWERRCTWTTT